MDQIALDSQEIKILADDGYRLGGTLYPANDHQTVVILNGATAVPHRFYRRFARCLQEQGWTVVTFDYRGIGASAPASLVRFEAQCRDWGLLDMQAALDWVEAELQPERIFLVGHSAGGQQAGMLLRPERVAAMATVSAQSGYWGVQGGWEKLNVFFLVYFLMPILTLLFGYFPWKRFGGEDLPKGVALEWARWCRSRNYLLGDKSLPLERYQNFKAPILAYSIDDDNWGTARSVDEMMSAYPNVERRHLVPSNYQLVKLGHMGYFRKGSEPLWNGLINWFENAV